MGIFSMAVSRFTSHNQNHYRVAISLMEKLCIKLRLILAMLNGYDLLRAKLAGNEKRDQLV
jgi:hypothetical protein